MSAVHDDIAMKSLSVQPEEIKNIFKDYIHDFKESSWYPDYFADRSMSTEQKDKIDTEADKFIPPLPPCNELYNKLTNISKEKYSYSGQAPLPMVYLIKHYLEKTTESILSGDIKAAIKFCGVFSHFIADIAEPVHAMDTGLMDVIVPPPKDFIGFELHANVEGLKAPVIIEGYKPKLLGKNIKQAEMGIFKAFIEAHKLGASLLTPIVQALYHKNTQEAIKLSSLVQSASSKHFADFIFTVFSLAGRRLEDNNSSLDLREYPYISNSVDMLYRYQPIIDASLRPYSGGKMYPLSLKDKKGTVSEVKGLGIVPPIGPPFTNDNLRIADVEYYIVPGAYTTFTANVGLNPLFEESMPTANFQVIGDGKRLAESRTFSPGDAFEEIKADLGNTRFLTLRMTYIQVPDSGKLNTVSSHLAWVSHGVWGNPVLF